MGLRTFVTHNFWGFKPLAFWGYNAGIYIALTGLFFSRYMLSLGLIVMGSAAFLHIFTMPGGEIRRRFQEHKDILGTILITVSALSAFIGSQDLDFAWTRFRLYAGFLLLPLIVMFSPGRRMNDYKNYFLFTVSAAVLATVIVYLNYREAIPFFQEGFLEGRPIETPVPHIRLGMFLVFTILGIIVSLELKTFNKKINTGLIPCGLILIAGILFFSIRTAWVLLVAGILVIVMRKWYYNRKILPLLAGVAFLMLVGFAAYKFIPSVASKVQYTLWDWKQVNTADSEKYSDSQRWNSLVNGWDLWKQHPVLGVGSGDLHIAMAQNASRMNIPLAVYPHNQFLFTMVCGGLLSLAFLMGGLLSTLRNFSGDRSFPLFLFFLLYIITMLVEPTFETSFGVLSLVLITVLIKQGSESIQNENRLEGQYNTLT